MRITITAVVLATIAFMLVAAGTPALEVVQSEPADIEPQSRVLRVGPQRELTRPSAAARIARDGDIIEIDAGTYAADAAAWRQNRLTIRAVGGRAHLRADGAHSEGKAIWVIKGRDTTIEGIEFSGATVSHGNGAGIRLEGPGLTVRNCYFHDNENGILTGAHRESDIVIEHSEFARNGAGDGYTHNIYIGTVRSFVLRFSYVHRAIIGHNVKSRAMRNVITYNRIMDEGDGTSSYLIDLSDGGIALVMGNLIQQGPAAENRTVVAYAAGGLRNPVNEFYFINNTVVNDLPAGGRFVAVNAASPVVRIINNLFSGPGELPAGIGEVRNNRLVSRSDFVNAAAYDYHPRRESNIPRSVSAGTANDLEFQPLFEYVHPAQKQARSAGETAIGALD